MKSLIVLVFSLFSFAVSAHSTDSSFNGDTLKAPYTLPVPEGWGVEKFPIPIGFAPGIPYRGEEDIRFAPGWGKEGGDNYWSYAFLWYLEGEVRMVVPTIEKNLKEYYTGLMAVNLSNIPAGKLLPVEASFTESPLQKGDLQSFTGTISMTDYMSQKPVVLRCKVHVLSCEGRRNTFIFFELSPQPWSHAIWSSLSDIRAGFVCPAPPGSLPAAADKP